VDEALWTAHLHPERLSQSLSAPEIRALHAAIRSVLRQGVRNRGTSLGDGKTNYNRLDGQRGRNQGILNVFRRTHAPCPACATPIQRMLVGQRSTHFCPHCQPEMHGSQGRSPSNRCQPEMHGSQGRSPSNRCQPEMHGSQGRSPSKKRISANRGVSTGGRASLRAVGKTR
jgi:hypothetical protein